MFFDEYWPWWLSALALTTVAVGHWIAIGRPFVVSGLWSRILRWRAEREAERADGQIGDDDAFTAALLAATREELDLSGGFEMAGGDDAGDDAGDDGGDDAGEELAGADQDGPVLERMTPVRPRLPLTAGAIFLASLVAGGFLASLASGTFAVRGELDPLFHELFGSGWAAVAVLVVGGALVGFGTSMAGGCTSGHGLNGCAARQPGSIVSTAAFFGTGIVVSMALGGLL